MWRKTQDQQVKPIDKQETPEERGEEQEGELRKYLHCRRNRSRETNNSNVECREDQYTWKKVWRNSETMPAEWNGYYLYDGAKHL